MTGFAHVTAIGRICTDLELKTTKSGKTLLPLTIAYDTGRDSPSTFLRCALWGNTAELVQKYRTKGDLIGFQGSLEQDDWEKDGVKHKDYKLQVRAFEFMQNKRDGDKPMTQAQALNGGRDVVIEDIDDAPIDLSAIPFN